jgi:hypothetical protein
MSLAKRLRAILLCLALGMGSLMGAPMRAEEIEELMAAMNQPKIAHTLRDETDQGDPP